MYESPDSAAEGYAEGRAGLEPDFTRNWAGLDSRLLSYIRA